MRSSEVFRYLFRYRVVASLSVLALLSRLPLLSASMDEIDSANFVNALGRGYDIALLRPHPPGYPVYVFMGWLLDTVLNDPRLSLVVLSAVLGSLSIIPFYSLLQQFVGMPMATVGSLLFIANPLFWSYSEAGLSDVPGVFLVLLLAWCCYRARHSSAAFLLACAVGSLAIGVRPVNLPLLVLLASPIAYRVITRKGQPWTLLILGIWVFLLITASWVLPMIWLGSEGLAHYGEAVVKQWTTAVHGFDLTQVGPPILANALIRLGRFLYAYLLTYPWTGYDAKTAPTLLMIVPWLFGLALFVTGFELRRFNHVGACQRF